MSTIWFACLAILGLMSIVDPISLGQVEDRKPTTVWHLREPDSAAPGFYAIEITADGKQLAARNRDNVVFLFDLEQRKKWYEFKGHETNWIQSINFSPDGKRFLTAAGSGEKLKVWRTSNGQLELEIATTSSRANFSDRGEQIIALGSSKVEYFDFPGGLPRGEASWRLSNEAADAMSRDGKLVVMHRRLSPQVYSLELLNLQTKLRIGLTGDTARPTQVIISPDKQWIAGSFENGNRLHLWNSSEPHEKQFVLDGHNGVITAIAFSADGRFLVSADEQSKVIVWDVLTRQSINKFETGQSAIRSMAFLPQLFHIAIGGVTESDSSIWIGDLRSTILKSNQARPESMDVIWKRLGSTTASTSLDAASALMDHFEQFHDELRETIFEATYEKSAAELDRLLAQLGDQKFLRREQASRRLMERLSHFEAPLRKMFKDDRLPVEQRYRVRRILMNRPATSRINVEIVRRWMRLILVLETVGTSQTQELLERIATGHPEIEISGSARAALQRLNSNQ